MLYRTLSAPISVQIEIDDDCNQACTHCYRSCQHIQKETKTEHLTPDKIEELVEKLADCKVMTVCFTGGEPLIFTDTLKAGIKKAAELGLVVYCNSNLQLLTPEMARFFRDYDVKILTSLLSHQPDVHDAIIQRKGFHKRLLPKIRMLTEAGVITSVNMVVRKENYHQVYETGKLAHELGVLYFSATKAAPSPDTQYRRYRAMPDQIKQSLDALLQLEKDFGLRVDILETYPLCFMQDMAKYQRFIRHKCTAGVFNCSISPNGDMRPCSHAGMSYGNLFEKPLKECWLAMQEWRDGVFLNEICKTCSYLLQCSGGCRIDAKIFYGDIRGKDPLMTGPEFIKPAVDPVRSDFPVPECLQFKKDVQIRIEEFGGVLKYNDEIVFLDEEGYNTALKLLDINMPFDWRTVQLPGVSEKDRELFIKILYDKKMFEAAV